MKNTLQIYKKNLNVVQFSSLEDYFLMIIKKNKYFR